MRNNQIKSITSTGLMAALIFLATYAIHIPIGGSGGYLHLGDTLVYLAAVVLPLPYAMLASAIGAGLSDVMVPGGMIWVPATLLIKPLCCLAFSRGRQLLCKRNMMALVAGGVITVAGYAVATAVITGSVAVAIAEIPLSVIQPIGSAVCFVALGAALDRANVLRNRPI